MIGQSAPGGLAPRPVSCGMRTTRSCQCNRPEKLMVSKTAGETTVVEATVASVVSLRQGTQQGNKPNECSSVFNLTLQQEWQLHWNQPSVSRNRDNSSPFASAISLCWMSRSRACRPMRLIDPQPD